MTWRIVQISSTCKLDLKLNHMVVRGEEQRKIHLGDIAVLIIDNTAVSMTAALLCALSRQNIEVIFCDERRNPYGELIPYYGTHDATDRLREQLGWGDNIKESVWTEIIRNKIFQQKCVLEEFGHMDAAEKLEQYMGELQHNDSSNREGHAAKVYFNALFGQSFSRKKEDAVNASLNYGYAILLSSFNREIVAAGYSTMLGIFHDNLYNQFNLGSDLMEPFRPLVDRLIIGIMPNELTPDIKKQLVGILNNTLNIDDQSNYVLNAIRIYCRSVFKAINENDISKLRFYENEGTVHESDRVF